MPVRAEAHAARPVHPAMAAGSGAAAIQDAPTPRSSFQLALRILPAAQRGAMVEIYAFCRAVDDIADGDTGAGPSVASPHDKRIALERWRSDVHACRAGIGAGVPKRGAAAIAAAPALPRVCLQLAGQARDHFDASAQVMRRQRRASVRTPRIMGAVYQALLARLHARGWAAPRRAVRVGTLQRAAILWRHVVP